MPDIGTNYMNSKAMDDWSPVPVGEYKAVITKSETRENKNGSGNHLALTIEIIEGEFQGRVIPVCLNLWHPNQQTVDIANRELTTIVHAVKKSGTSKSEDLHNIPMIISVGVEQGKPWVDANGQTREGRPQNKIKIYKEDSLIPASQAAPAQAAPITVQTKPAPAVAGQPPVNPATGLPYKPWENWPGK